MVEFRKITNKTGEVLTTKEGKELVEIRLEVGDTFIPRFNRPLEKSRDVETIEKGKTVKKKITNYSIKAKVRDATGQKVVHDGKEEIFISLTPSQAQSLQKKADEGIELNQNIFVAYEYESKSFGLQIGVGLKKANKPAKEFEDFENETKEDIQEEQPEVSEEED